MINCIIIVRLIDHVTLISSLEEPVETLSDIARRDDKVPLLIRNDPIHQLLMVC